MWPFRRRAAKPEVAMVVHPVNVNPTMNERQRRNVERLARLKNAIQDPTLTPEQKTAFQREINRRENS